MIWLIIGSVAAALSVVPASMIGMMSVMASDGGVNAAIYTFIYVSLTFPIAIIVAPIAAWIAFWLRRERISWILLFSPFAWAVTIIALLVIASGGG